MKRTPIGTTRSYFYSSRNLHIQYSRLFTTSSFSLILHRAIVYTWYLEITTPGEVILLQIQNSIKLSLVLSGQQVSLLYTALENGCTILWHKSSLLGTRDSSENQNPRLSRMKCNCRFQLFPSTNSELEKGSEDILIWYNNPIVMKSHCQSDSH